MKRILAIVLVLCMAFAFCGCGGKKANINDIESKASKGEMPESEFALGTEISVIKNAFSDDSEQELLVREGTETVVLSIDNFDYHYYKAKEQNGISVIVNFSNAFGFENGITMSNEIIEVLGDGYTLDAATDDQIYFLRSVTDGCEVLSYTYGDYKLEFYFIDYFLAATKLTDTRYWVD
ncbi:MAG: hypothetical protein J6I80_03690 [Clostridia bacterium]|nr:hypothetical protein [Clostridia bacterium]